MTEAKLLGPTASAPPHHQLSAPLLILNFDDDFTVYACYSSGEEGTARLISLKGRGGPFRETEKVTGQVHALLGG